MTRILFQNASLLITLSFFYSIFRWYRPKKDITYQLISGIWFGIVAVAAMMMPYEYRQGIIYDGRSVILTLSGLWGGGLATAVAAIIAGAFRLYLGGAGVWAGLSTIVLCGATGLLFRQYYFLKLHKINFFTFWAIGMVAHLVMLASQFLIPDHPLLILERIWYPVIMVFPVAFALISKLIQVTELYFLKNEEIKEAGELYRTTLLSIGDAVICTDDNGKITQMNKVAEDLTGWNFTEAIGKQLEDVFRIINEHSRQDVESPYIKIINQGAIANLDNQTLLISKDGREIPISDSGAPIVIKDKITGVVLVFRDQSEERRKQQVLRESEARYREREFWLRESQRVGKIGSYDMDIKNDIWSSSEVLDEIFGIDKSYPHTTEGWQSIVHPEHQKEMLDYFLNFVIVKKNKFEKDYKIIRVNDGAERWVLGQGELNFNESGDPVRMFGTIQDITERKNFEQQLAESEERFRKAVLYSPIPVMVHDEDGNILSLSEGWNHFSGYYINEIPTFTDWVVKAFGDNAPETESYFNSIFKEDKTVFGGEFEITAKNGKKRIWNFYITPLGLSGGKKIILSMAPDVTQRIKIKNQLEERERTYRQLFENHAAVKMLIDPDSGKIVKANKAASDFYGWSIAQLESMNIREISALPVEEISNWMNLVRNNIINYFECKHRLSKGQIRDVEIFSSQTEYMGKLLLHSIIHDITEKKRLMDELVEAKEKAEESDRLKSAFLANMSHEIRTPLNGIIGFSNLLANEENLSPEDKKNYSQIINKNTEGLLKIINDILDISRLESELTVIGKQLFNARTTLLSLYLIFNEKLKETGKNDIRLILKETSDPVILNTDENRLIQIFSNLLDNAIRFTNKGTVSFGINKISSGQIEFFVSDTGIGIPKEKQQMVFDRFFQAENGFSRRYGGTGLGLSIVKKLVEKMGGNITLESEPGKGSTFYFKLPYETINNELKKGNNNEWKQQGFETLGIDINTKILIAEDNADSQFYFKQILSKKFKNIYFVTTGKETLNNFDNITPDVLLIDINLPDINGLEVVRRIRKNNKNTIIIAQTAYASADDQHNTLEAGCNEFITKPLNKDLLFEKIFALLNK